VYKLAVTDVAISVAAQTLYLVRRPTLVSCSYLTTVRIPISTSLSIKSRLLLCSLFNIPIDHWHFVVFRYIHIYVYKHVIAAKHCHLYT